MSDETVYHEQYIKHDDETAKITYTFTFYHPNQIFSYIELVDFSEVKLVVQEEASPELRAYMQELAADPARLQREAFYMTAEYLNGASGTLERDDVLGQMVFGSDIDLDDPCL